MFASVYRSASTRVTSEPSTKPTTTPKPLTAFFPADYSTPSAS